MNTCSTCKHWERSDVPTYENQGTCQKIDGKDGCGEKLVEGELAQAQAGYTWTSVWLETHATFGCVLHEPKDGGSDREQTDPTASIPPQSDPHGA